jgi:hypothetical protein
MPMPRSAREECQGVHRSPLTTTGRRVVGLGVRRCRCLSRRMTAGVGVEVGRVGQDASVCLQGFRDGCAGPSAADIEEPFNGGRPLRIRHGETAEI